MKMQRTESHSETGLLVASKSAPLHGGGGGDFSGKTRQDVLGHEPGAHRAKGNTRDGKSSSKNGSRHTKRPPSERRFKCEQCERMFFTRKDVKRHMVVHTGVRNFACPYCQQRFGRKDHLVRHAKKSHNRDTRSSASFSGSTQMPSNSCARKGSMAPGGGHHGGGLHGALAGSSSSSSAQQAHAASSLPMSALHESELSALMSPLEDPHPSFGNGHHHHSGGDHPSPLLLLAGHGHMGNGSYAPSPLSALSNAGHYSSGGHHQDDGLLLHQSHHHLVKPEPGSHPHYFPFPVSSSASFAGSSLMSSCFVSSAGRGLCGPGSGNGLPGHHHQLQMPVCGDHGQPSINPFALDMNPQLPHFQQAFQ